MANPINPNPVTTALSFQDYLKASDPNRPILADPVSVKAEPSQYDAGFVLPRVNPEQALKDHRANAQPWEDKLGNGLANMGTSAFTGALESTLGVVYGASAALASGNASSFYNNEFGKMIDSINESVRESNPFYYSKAEEEASLLSSMGTANFWYDKVLGGAGYTLGSFATGYGAAKLFNMGKTARLAQLSAEASAAEAAGNLTAEAAKYARWDMAKQAALGFTMAHGESSMEARQTYDETKQNYEKLRSMAELDPANPEYAEYLNMSDAKIEQLATDAADTNYLLNLAVTGPTDMMLLGKWINPGKQAAVRTYNELGKRTAVNGATEYFDKVVTQKGRALLNAGSKFMKGFTTEGAQEGLQFASNKAAQEFVQLHGVQNQDWFTSMTTGLAEGLGQAVSTKEGLESILVGGFAGGPFGMKGAASEVSAKDARTKILVDKLNADPNFAQANPLVQKMLASTNSANNAEEHLKNGDMFKAKNAADQSLNTYIKGQIDAGTTDYFVERLESIKQMEQEERDKFFGPGTTTQQIDQIIDKTRKLEQLHNSIETLYGTPGGTPEQKQRNAQLREMLFFSASTIKDVEGRMDNIVKDLTSMNNAQVSAILAARQTAIGMQKAVTPENLPAGKVLEEYRDEMQQQATENYNALVKQFQKDNPIEASQAMQYLADLNQLDERKNDFIKYYNELNDPEKAAALLKKTNEDLAKIADELQKFADREAAATAQGRTVLEDVDTLLPLNKDRKNEVDNKGQVLDISKLSNVQLEDMQKRLMQEETEGKEVSPELKAAIAKEIEFRTKTDQIRLALKEKLTKATTPQEVDDIIAQTQQDGSFNVNPDQIAKLKKNLQDALDAKAEQEAAAEYAKNSFKGVNEFFHVFPTSEQEKTLTAQVTSDPELKNKTYFKLVKNPTAGTVVNIGSEETKTLNPRLKKQTPGVIIEVWTTLADGTQAKIGVMPWFGQYVNNAGNPINIQNLTFDEYVSLFLPGVSKETAAEFIASDPQKYDLNAFKRAHAGMMDLYASVDGLMQNAVERLLSPGETKALVGISVSQGTYNFDDAPLSDFQNESTVNKPVVLNGTPVIISTSTFDGSVEFSMNKEITSTMQVASVLDEDGNPVVVDTQSVEGGIRAELLPALNKLRERITQARVGETIYNKYWMLVEDPQGTVEIPGIQGSFDWRPVSPAQLTTTQVDNIMTDLRKVAKERAEAKDSQTQDNKTNEFNNIRDELFIAISSSDAVKSFRNVNVSFSIGPKNEVRVTVDFRFKPGNTPRNKANTGEVYSGRVFMTVPDTVKTSQDFINWFNKQLQEEHELSYETAIGSKVFERVPFKFNQRITPITQKSMRTNFKSGSKEQARGIRAINPSNVWDSFSVNVSRVNPRKDQKVVVHPVETGAGAVMQQMAATSSTTPVATTPQTVTLAPGLTSGQGEVAPAVQAATPVPLITMDGIKEVWNAIRDGKQVDPFFDEFIEGYKGGKYLFDTDLKEWFEKKTNTKVGVTPTTPAAPASNPSTWKIGDEIIISVSGQKTSIYKTKIIGIQTDGIFTSISYKDPSGNIKILDAIDEEGYYSEPNDSKYGISRNVELAALGAAPTTTLARGRGRSAGGAAFTGANSIGGGFSEEESVDRETAIANIRGLLPNFIGIGELLPTLEALRDGRITFGSFYNNMVRLAAKFPKGREFHEAFHAVFRTMFTNKQLDALYKEAKALMISEFKKEGKSFAQAYGEWKNDRIDYENLPENIKKDLFIEEWMADEYPKWREGKSVVPKKATTLIGRIFDTIKRFIDWISGTPSLGEVFQALDEGKFSGAKNPVMNRFTNGKIDTIARSQIYVGNREGHDGQIYAAFLDPSLELVLVNTFASRVLERQKTNPEISREEIIGEMMEEYAQKFNADNPVYDNIANDPKHSDVFEKVLDLDFLFRNNEEYPVEGQTRNFGEEAREMFIEKIEKALKEYSVDEYSSEANEENSDGSNDVTERNFDQNFENKGGFTSLSKFLRSYIGKTTYNTTLEEFFGLPAGPDGVFGGEVITVAVNPKKVYNGLVKLTANQASAEAVLRKMAYAARENSESGRFVAKFFAEAGINFDQNGTLTYDKNKTALTQSVVKGFSNFSLNYLFTQFDRAFGEKSQPFARIFAANTRGMDTEQLGVWEQRFQALKKRLGPQRMAELAQNVRGLNHLTLTTRIDDALVEQVVTTLKSDLEGLGISLSKMYLKYLVLQNRVQKSEAQRLFIEEFEQSVKMNATDVHASLVRITQSIAGMANPYQRGVEKPSDEDKSAVTRLRKIAMDNAVFDENVAITTMVNADGKNIYPYQKANYHVQRIFELRSIDFSAVDADGNPLYPSEVHTEQPNQDYILNNYLLNNPDFREMLKTLQIERIDGVRQTTLEERDGDLKVKLDGKTREGTTYGGMTERELLLQFYSLFADASTDTKVNFTMPDGTVKRQPVRARRMAFNIMEASNTMDVLNMPVQTVYQDGKFTDKFKQAVLDNIVRELNRINKVRAGMYVDAQGNPIQYVNFNSFNSENKLRGLQFWENARLLDSLGIRKQLESGELSLEEAVPAILNGMDKFFENELNEHMEMLQDAGILNNEGKNRLLPAKFDGVGIEGDTMFSTVMRDNIGNAYFNMYLNATAIDQVLMGDPALTLKDSVDWFKRAKGNNAAGDNLTHFDASYNAPVKTLVFGRQTENGTFDDFVNTDYVKQERIYKIGSKEYNDFANSLPEAERAAFLAKSPEEIKVGDAQAYTTVEGMLRFMINLGRMTTNGERIYRKVAAGGTLTQQDWKYLKDNGLMMNSQKLVYFDGVTYVKMSIVPLTPEYTTTPAGTPIKGMEFLHNLRMEMERNGIEMAGQPSMMKKMIRNPLVLGEGQTDFTVNPENTIPLDLRYLRLQQENPSNKDEITDPTQMLHLIAAEQDPSTPIDFPWDPSIKTVGQLVKKYDGLLAERIRTQYIPARNFLTQLQEGERTLNTKRLVKAFRKMLETTGASQQLLDYLRTDDAGYPIENFNLPHIVTAFEQHFNNYFNKVFKQKVPGYKTTLQSGFGHKLIYDTKTGKIIPRNVYLQDPAKYDNDPNIGTRDLGFDIPHIVDGKELYKYSEVVLPFHFAEQFGLKAGDEIPIEIADMFGTRIPSQDKHSARVLRIVDVMPASYGSNMITPHELILLTGFDFDVDSYYNQRFDHYVKDGEFRVYGNNKDSKWEQFTNWHKKNNSLVRDLMNELEGNLEFDKVQKLALKRVKMAEQANEKVSVLGYLGEGYDSLTEQEKQLIADRPDAIAAYNRAKEIVKQLREQNFHKALKMLGLPSTEEELAKSDMRTPGEINNDILRAKMVLHSNKKMEDINKTPATLDAIQNSEGTGVLDMLASQLGYKSWKDLEKTYNPTSVMGMVTAFVTNKAGSKAIGAAVNNSQVYAVLTRFGLKAVEKDGMVKIKIGGFTIGDINPNEMKTEDGKRIMDILSTLTSSMTDNPKYGYNSKMNVDINTLSILSLMTMNRIRLITGAQMLISEYVRKFVSESRSYAIQTERESDYQGGAYNRLVNELREKLKNIDPALLDEFEKQEGMPVTQEDLNLAMEFSPERKEFKEATAGQKPGLLMRVPAEYYMAQYRILSAYNEMSKKHVGEFIAFSQIMKLTKGISSSNKETSFKGDEEIRQYLDALGLELVATRDGWQVEYKDKEARSKQTYDFKEVINQHLVTLENLAVFGEKGDIQKTYFISQTNFSNKVKDLIARNLNPRLGRKKKAKAMAATRENLLAYLMLKAWRKQNNVTENMNAYLFPDVATKEGMQSMTELRDKILAEHSHLRYNLVFEQVFFADKGGLNIAKYNTWSKGNKGFESLLLGEMRRLANSEARPLVHHMIKYMIAKEAMLFKNDSPISLINPSTLATYGFSQNMTDFTPMLNSMNDAQLMEMFGMTSDKLLAEFTELFMRDVNNRDFTHKFKSELITRKDTEKASTVNPVTPLANGAFKVNFDAGYRMVDEETGDEIRPSEEIRKIQIRRNNKVFSDFGFKETTSSFKNKKDETKQAKSFEFPLFVQSGGTLYKLKSYVPVNNRFDNTAGRYISPTTEGVVPTGIEAVYEPVERFGGKFAGVTITPYGRSLAENTEKSFDKLVKERKVAKEAIEEPSDTDDETGNERIDESNVTPLPMVSSSPMWTSSTTGPQVTAKPVSSQEEQPGSQKQAEQGNKAMANLNMMSATTNEANNNSKDMLLSSFIVTGLELTRKMYMKMYVVAGMDQSKLPKILVDLARAGIFAGSPQKPVTEGMFKDAVREAVNKASTEDINEMSKKLCS